MMVRRFVTLDGAVLAEEEWELKPIDICFYCDQPLIAVQGLSCTGSQFEQHEFITLCDREM